MTLQSLLAELTRLGVRLEVQGNHLRFSPRTALTPELLCQLTAHKDEILHALSAPAENNQRSVMRCPFCKSANLAEADGLETCRDCGNAVWLVHEGSIIRADTLVEDRDVIPPPPPCPVCRGLNLWQSLAGNWRCNACDPPRAARRLRTRAAQLRSGNKRPPHSGSNRP
jgi:ribosomal protein L37AE/L43A